MKSIKTIEDLIKFYESIPENKWGKGAIKKSGRKCAIGHFISENWDWESHLLVEKITVKALVKANDEENDKSAKENILTFLKGLK